MGKLGMAWMLWAAMVFACGLYVVVGFLVHDATEEPAIPNLRWILLGISAVQVVLTEIVLTPSLLRRLKRAEGEARTDLALFLVVIRSAVFEAIAIYGLILIILNQRLIDGIIFSGLAIALMMHARPQADHFDPHGSID